MADPRSMIAPPRQPLGWPTHRFQHCLKTVMPSRGKLSRNRVIKTPLVQILLPFLWEQRKESLTIYRKPLRESKGKKSPSDYSFPCPAAPLVP